MNLKTCTHLHDDGGKCKSAAVTGQNYCIYHLRYRARLHRTAQYRARGERFDLRLPPLESMHAVQSALQQLVEAVAADMIDLKRADFLLKSLRFAAQALKNSDKWQPSVYHTDAVAPAVNLTAEYGLPNDLDLNLSPELAFPPPDSQNIAPSEQAAPDTDLSQDPYVAQLRKDGILGDDFEFRPDFPVTPDYVELDEVRRTQGDDASLARSTQMVRNQRRRAFHSERKRYAKIAAQINLHRAAEKLLSAKLAAEKVATQNLEPEPIETRKPPMSAAIGDDSATKEVATA